MAEPPPPLTLPDLSLDHASRFLAAVGLTITQAGPDRVTGRIDLGPEHHTPWGVVHGGVYTAAVETAASIGASAAVAGRGQIAVGVHNATDFLPRVVAEPIQQGRTQQLWQVIITRESDGKELARGQLRLQNVAPPA